MSGAIKIFAAALLSIALGNHSYSYYTLLRIVICSVSFYSGWLSSKQNKHGWAWFFFIVGVLFNPILPFYLDRATWKIIDIGVAISFIFSFVESKKKNVV